MAGTSDSAEAESALERLCYNYWYPIYAYIRRRGFNAEDGQDLTQSFFTHLLARDRLHSVSPEKGKFRSFLLASLNNFLSDQWDRSTAQKRGGGSEILSLDFHLAEERFREEPSDTATPTSIFERRWALAFLDQVLARLRQEFADAGKLKVFEKLSVHLVEGSSNQTMATTAQALGQSEEAVKKAVQRMRHRYSELFRVEIANTVSSPAEVEEELRYLCSIIGSAN